MRTEHSPGWLSAPGASQPVAPPRFAQGQPRVSLGSDQESEDLSSSPDSGASARPWSWPLSSWPASVNGTVAFPQGRAVRGPRGACVGEGAPSATLCPHTGGGDGLRRGEPGSLCPARRVAVPPAPSVTPLAVSPRSGGAEVSIWGRRVCRKREAVTSVPCEWGTAE